MDPARDALEVTLPAFGQEQREEIDLEEEVAELVEQLGVVALLGRVGHLVGLLDRVRHDRAGRLLAIPGAIPPQPLGELLELEQRVTQAGLVGRRSSSGRDGRSEARTQGVAIVNAIARTEDAASGRAARPEATSYVPPGPP